MSRIALAAFLQMGVAGFWNFGELLGSIGYLVCARVEAWFYISEKETTWSRVNRIPLEINR